MLPPRKKLSMPGKSYDVFYSDHPKTRAAELRDANNHAQYVDHTARESHSIATI